MSNLMLHCGASEVTLDELKSIDMPKETSTYVPVSHYDLVTNINMVATDLLPSYELTKNKFGVSRQGQQMFGVTTFKNSNDEMGLSIGYRNSYDKTMSVGIAIGAIVFVCDNLALTGTITVMRKHTINVWNDLKETIVTSIYQSKNNFIKIVEDSNRLKEIPLNNQQVYAYMGRLYGNGVISNNMLTKIKKEWHKPRFEEFEPRTAWSFYNSCTEALKKSPPLKIMKNHIDLHKFMMNEAN